MRKNEQIRAFQVSVISQDGKALGVFPRNTGIEMARNEGMDLVEVNGSTIPPVCKIADYGKMLYTQKKNKPQQVKVETKTMQYRPVIGDSDFMVKTRKVQEFLEEGNRVCIQVKFRGREMTHPELGFEVIQRVIELVGAKYKFSKPNMADKIITMAIE